MVVVSSDSMWSVSAVYRQYIVWICNDNIYHRNFKCQQANWARGGTTKEIV